MRFTVELPAQVGDVAVQIDVTSAQRECQYRQCKFPGSLQVLNKVNLPSKALQVLIIFVSQSLQLYKSNTKLVKMHMSSYKSLSFFQVSNTGWFHTVIKFQNQLDMR